MKLDVLQNSKRSQMSLEIRAITSGSCATILKLAIVVYMVFIGEQNIISMS
jgi:hypothetical protein